jgi:hypothetical protein
MAEEVLAKSRKLADDDKSTQAQATGQLHAGLKFAAESGSQ